MDEKTKRIIDANINRISEGLRVAEDIFRYGLDSSEFQQSFKSLRHFLMASLDREKYIDCRGSLDDVGFSSHGENEYQRDGLKDILSANLKRAGEGLRVLEEIFKLENADTSLKMKQLRYNLYEVEKKGILFLNKKILRKGLYLIMSDLSEEDCKRLAEIAVKSGIPALELRMEKATDRQFINTASRLHEATKGTDTLFIVYQRPDMARLSGSDGLHLEQNDISPEMARDLLGDEKIIGLSTHNLAQVEEAQNQPLDYISFGPVWGADLHGAPDSKSGIGRLKEAVRISKRPVVAMGGINKGNMMELSDIYVNNIAVLRSVQEAADIYEEMKIYGGFRGRG